MYQSVVSDGAKIFPRFSSAALTPECDCQNVIQSKVFRVGNKNCARGLISHYPRYCLGIRSEQIDNSISINFSSGLSGEPVKNLLEDSLKLWNFSIFLYHLADFDRINNLLLVVDEIELSNYIMALKIPVYKFYY